MSSKYKIVITRGAFPLCRDVKRMPTLYLQISAKFLSPGKSRTNGVTHKLSDGGLFKGHCSRRINQVDVRFRF